MERVVYIELLTSSMCPNNCKYCYIPKDKSMLSLHNKIRKSLDVMEQIDKIEKTYPDITMLGLWGAEPTTTMDIIVKNLKLIKYKLKKLHSIELTTSMLSNHMIILELWKACSDNDLNLNMQISLDGPAFITDINRSKGSAQKIPENLYELLREANKYKFKNNIKITWKATWTIDNIREMNTDESKIKMYYSYFQNIRENCDNILKNPNIDIRHSSSCPTLMVPGRYTTEDGKEWAKLTRTIHKIGGVTAYDYRILEKIEWLHEMYKRSMFSCCAGDTALSIGIDNDYHMCHRSLFLNMPEYTDSVLAKSNYDNWDVSTFNKETLEQFNKNFIVKTDDDYEYTRLKYLMNGFHSHWNTSLSSSIATINELALSNQLNNIYLKDEYLKFIFAFFVNSSIICPMENNMTTGSVFITPLSLYRMHGNGAFIENLRWVLNERQLH